MSKIFSLCLFHTSFAPLWFSIFIIDIMRCTGNSPIPMTECISIGCILTSFIISIFLLFGKLRSIGKDKENTTQYKLITVTEEKTIYSEFLLSYILPLFAFDFSKWDHIVLFLLFYLMLAFLCIRHNYFNVNIILEFANYRFFTCTIENEDHIQLEKRILSQYCLTGCIGDNIILKSFNNEYKLDIRS